MDVQLHTTSLEPNNAYYNAAWSDLLLSPVIREKNQYAPISGAELICTMKTNSIQPHHVQHTCVDSKFSSSHLIIAYIWISC